MVRHRRGRFQRAAIFQIGGDPGRAETVVADRRPDLGSRRAPAHHREGIGLRQGGPRLARHSSTFSGVGASDKSGAVQVGHDRELS